MSKHVQAIDPSSGVWLRAKVIGSEGLNIKVKWQNYNLIDLVPEFKTRDPRPHRKCAISRELWPTFKHPKELQLGDLVCLSSNSKPVDLQVEENDPFLAEVGFFFFFFTSTIILGQIFNYLNLRLPCR